MNKIGKENLVDTASEWRGYTLDDLRYKRAVNHVKMEVAKERVMISVGKFTNFKTPSFASSKLVGKIFSSFSVIDYLLIAFQTGKQVRKIFRLFKH
jgi:hypothetical protein